MHHLVEDWQINNDESMIYNQVVLQLRNHVEFLDLDPSIQSIPATTVKSHYYIQQSYVTKFLL